MKRTQLSTFLMLLLILTGLMSCNDAPKNRPLLDFSNSNVTEPEPTPEEIDKAETDRVNLLRRPDNAVKITSDYCACQNFKAVSWGSNCDNFCSAKADAAITLYLNVTVTSDISERADIGTFYNWCTKQILDPVTEEVVGTPPTCAVEFKTRTGSVALAANIPNLSPGSNSFKVQPDGIPLNETYRVRVTNSDGDVASSTVQIRVTDTPITDPVGGPLWTLPAFSYSCLNITTSSDNVSLFYDDASRIYFYFTHETRPDPLAQIFANIFCHDKDLFGSTPINSPLLEETPGALHLWNALDPRFFDTDGNGEPQINDLIKQSIINQGSNITTTPNLFYKFQWAVGPKLDANTTQDGGGSTSGQADNADLGYYMTPWTDQSTFKSYCPTQSHYYSNNQLFIALRELVAIDTEALYIAQEESKDALLLVRESDIKPIWFFKENGVNIEPDENSVVGKKIQFHWPPAANSPYIKKSHQSTYTVKRASEIGDSVSQSGQNNSGTPTSYPAHDKRIGCIPKL